MFDRNALFHTLTYGYDCSVLRKSLKVLGSFDKQWAHGFITIEDTSKSSLHLKCLMNKFHIILQHSFIYFFKS